MKYLDWNDKAAVRAFLVDARHQADDIDATIQDTFLPPEERDLGPALVRENYESVMRSLRFLLDYAIGPEGFPPEGEPETDTGDPAGNGDAGPVL
jgi:hypothetical protein